MSAVLVAGAHHLPRPACRHRVEREQVHLNLRVERGVAG
jgi:hypothetical protein